MQMYNFPSLAELKFLVPPLIQVIRMIFEELAVLNVDNVYKKTGQTVFIEFILIFRLKTSDSHLWGHLNVLKV